MNDKKTMKKAKKEEESLDESQLSESEMKDILVELYETKFWKAIKQYYIMRCIYTDDALRSIDPFKNPTDMARSQGIFLGLNDLEIFIVEEKRRREKAEGAENEGKTE